ncbi:MAG TPA: CYTH domain-containing protein [Cerasibacillus sp.]|uniref:CYTH domain-containing protein n=1 Tax=Cerasibacillus sp. TaxID=2498711 RepID=UPI002F3F6281
MKQEIEIEFKNLLTTEEYNFLLNALPFPKEGKEQINHYFETESFDLKSCHSALRIREKEGKFYLTLKEPYESGLLETHDSLTKNEVSQWIAGAIIPKPNTLNRLKHLNINPTELQYFGSLTTIRRQYERNGFIFVLDKSMYNGCTDYELEIEAPSYSTGKTLFLNLLEQYKIKQKTTPNKIERFFNSK